MLKHEDLTLKRIQQFIERELRKGLIQDTEPLPTQFLRGTFLHESAARKADGWEAVEPGFKWGPAYAEGWYWIKAKMPKRFEGQEVALAYHEPQVAPQMGNMVEGTLWRDGIQVGGLDFGHPYFRLTDEADAGEKIDLLVQTYAHNAETTVHGWEQPRTPEPEEFRGFYLATLNTDLLGLYFDCEFLINLVDGQEETDPCRAGVVRALNEVCNRYRADSPKTISVCRKILRDCRKEFNSSIPHTITPVGHAHLDTAWLWPLSVTHLKMAHTTAVQLELMERYPEHVFAHSQASQYEWLEQEHPELYERVKKAIKRGQWEVVGSMWVEADCNLTGAESLVRQFLYGRRWFKDKLGVTTDDMWLPDVFGYSAALPQILSQFGIKYFLTQKLSWNQFNKIPHHTFWWKGIDGSQVWTHFPPADTYCASAEPKQLLESVKKFKDHGRSGRSLLLYGFGDGGGGPTEFNLERLRRCRLTPCLPQVEKKATAVSFMENAKAEAEDLLTWSGELYFELHRGTYTSQAANKKLNRETEFLLRDAEWLACFRGDFPKGYPQEQLERAWKLVLLNQFHDIIPGSSVMEVYADSLKDYAVVKEIGAEVIEDSLKQIGSQLDTSGMKKPLALFHNSRIPSQAEVAWPAKEKAPQSLRVGDEVLPVQMVEEFGESKVIFATPDDALGAVAVGEFSGAAPHETPRLKSGPRKMENDEWSVRFDANGNITSITSLDDERTEFIAPGHAANMFQIFDDNPTFWDAWDVDIYSLETAQDLAKSDSFGLVEKGPVRAAVEIVKTFGKSKIVQRISLGPTPGIRFDTWVDWHEDNKMLKVAFPLNVNTPRASFEIQFGHVERPTHRNTSWDVARFEVCHQKWMDMSEGGHGAALLNDGKYGCDVLDNVMRLTLLRSPKAPDPNCDMGEHRFTYVLLPHYDQLPQSDVVAASYALNSPVRTAWLKPQKGTEGTVPQLLTSDSMHLIIESVKKAEDSSLVLARCYECHNARGSAQISSALPIKRAWKADLSEQPLEEIEVEDGSVNITYRPFEIITLLLEV